MNDDRDRSMMASLKMLMSIEEQRVREEQAARDRARAAEEETRAQAARRAREEEETRLRLEEERRRTEESRRREEEAKLAAIHAATMERARIEAETRARIELLARQQEGERVIAAIAHKHSGARRAVLAGIASAAALLAAALGIYHGKIKPEAERVELAHQAALRDQEERNRKLAEEQQRLEQKIADAERQIFEEQKKKAVANATAQPTVRPSSRPAVRPPRAACKPCSDPASPLCDGNGCELNR